MLSQEISKRWIDFFASRGHTVVPSASLISNEPGAMFTIAGMVPFIPYFLGRETPPVLPRDQRAEVHPHPGHRRGR